MGKEDCKTMDNTDEIRLMLENDVQADVVAAELGIAKPTVYRVADQILAERRHERNKKIVAAYRAEWPIKVICDTFDISTATVYNILNKFNIARRHAHSIRSDETDAAIVAMYRQGATVKSIQMRWATTKDYIYTVIHNAGIPLRRPQKVESETPEPVIEEYTIQSILTDRAAQGK